jgi:hypothetical protein
MKRVLIFISMIALAKTVVLALTAPDVSLCPPIPPHAPPTNVHDLRADDIKVIAALGDRYDLKMSPFLLSSSHFFSYIV